MGPASAAEARRSDVTAPYERVAVVTGAASGIGRATARALAASATSVACVDVDADRTGRGSR
jgi:NAD(P)-dependent dehydrogenase (short-subunit alcohol dehydrogenase family)